MKKHILTIAIVFHAFSSLFATGEPSTYFNIFVPPNNDPTHRHVALVITAIYDSTYFEIIDDGMDGDTDDSHSGMLMANQSYVLYIMDNGVNDDADWSNPNGEQKGDGDYFTIQSSKLVYASQSTDSDWQYDWVPSTNKSSKGKKFVVYAPKASYSNRDINVFAYEDATTVTIKRISPDSVLWTGYTNIDQSNAEVIVQQTLNVGQDLIRYFTDGQNLLRSGHTYLIESNKDVTVQYGALYDNARDGGGYVPSSNGSSSGELFYFTVPFQTEKEQEIRVVSWDASNTISLDRYYDGSWIALDNWSLNALETGDWVGAEANATYPTVFRLQCSAGKKVSVFTANWLETGNPGTSDMATMASSKNGTSSGDEFLCYMAPPGDEQSVLDPFTMEHFDGQYTHLYLFAYDSANVTVTDAYTGGLDFSQTFHIAPGRYADCALSLAQWQAIYNGDGSASSGPERPYLHVSSDANIAVMNTNFNDNWMMYFGSSLEQSFSQESHSSNVEGAPGDTISVTSDIVLNTTSPVENVSGEVTIGSGAIPTSSTFIDSASQTSIEGVITVNETNSVVTFDSLPNLESNGSYSVVTEVVLLAGENNGSQMENESVVSIETAITGTVEGVEQQSVTTEGISNNTANDSNLIFSHMLGGFIANELTNSWNASWVDMDGDDDQDLFVSSQDVNAPNRLYRNLGNGSFSSVTTGAIVNTNRKTMSSAWADVDNDGDMDALIVNNNYDPVELYLNNGTGSFTKTTNSGLPDKPGYFHGAGWADYDNDGLLDLILTNYMPTQFHELYHNEGNGLFSAVSSSPISSESNHTVAPTWIDYDNDGLIDLFIPNNLGADNSLFHNDGGAFTKASGSAMTSDGGHSVAACWADVDNDGDQDLFVGNSSQQKDFFYFNNGDGSFTRDSTLSFADHKTNTHGCSWLDVDNDMDLDLYLTDDQGAKQLYIQNSGFVFTKKLDEAAVINYGKSYGQAVADYDQDGHLDVFVSTHSDEVNHLWKNNGNENNFINIHLIGTVSNTSAIGAQVKIKAGDVWQTKSVNGQNGFGSQNSLNLHFGLAENTSADTVIIDWPSGFTQIETGVLGNQFISITESTSARVSGMVYYDANNNCSLDSGELTLANQRLTISPSGKEISTNDQGEFQTRLENGSYTLSYNPKDYWTASCSSINLNVSSSSANITEQNIAVSAQSLGSDLYAEYATTAWRRGFLNESHLRIGNKGTQTAYGVSVSVTMPAEMSINSSSLPWNHVLSNTFTWVIDTLQPGDITSILLEDSVGLSAFVGQTLSVQTTVTSSSSELDATNNNASYTDEVVGAIDPNDLIAWPKPQGQNMFAWVSKGDTITYKIRFQNIGSYEASKVLVKTNVPDGLMIETFDLISTSHSCSYTVSEDGNIEWRFIDINLPDSSSNEAGSHGFITFSVVVSKKASQGQAFPMQASITFDFEEAIETNRVLHKLSTSGNKYGRLSISPNPVGKQSHVSVTIQSNELGLTPILTDLSVHTPEGFKLKTMNGFSKQFDMYVGNLNKGVYILRGLDEEGNIYSGKLIIGQ